MTTRASFSYSHPHSTQYASPIIREPSPASTVGSAHAEHREDLTSFSDSEEILSQEDFEKKWIDRIGTCRMREDEERACIDPVPERPDYEDDDPRALALHEERLVKLRKVVKKIEEDYLFEQTILKGSQIGMEPLPSSDDVDGIIGAMMGDAELMFGFSGMSVKEEEEEEDEGFVEEEDVKLEVDDDFEIPERGRSRRMRIKEEDILDGPWKLGLRDSKKEFSVLEGMDSGVTSFGLGNRF